MRVQIVEILAGVGILLLAAVVVGFTAPAAPLKHLTATHAPHALLSGQTSGYMFWAYDPNTNGLYRENGFIYNADCNTVRTWIGSQVPAVTLPPTLPLVVSAACMTDQGGED